MDDNRFSFDNPLRPVDSRSRVAEKLRRAGRFPSPRRYDAATCEIAMYLSSTRHDGPFVNQHRFAARHRDLHQAFELHNTSHPRLRAAVEAMLLTDMHVDAISLSVGVKPSCIEWYAAAFFDVRGRLSCSHFIVHQVIEDSRERSGDSWYQWGWKLVAYLGGRAVLEEAMGTGGITNMVALASALQRETRLVLKAKAARLVSDLPAEDATVLTKLLQAFEATSESSTEHVPNPYDENVKAMMESIPWTIGTLNEPTPLTDFEKSPAEARADEMLLMGMGIKLPYAEALLAKKFPKPAANSAE